MINEKPIQCKSKGCYNPVLYGKYCEQCKQIRKEKKDKIMAGVAGAAILVFGFVKKKDLLKNALNIAAKVFR